eukprot:scaffold172_cov254-Pinguiococcus_pyrenoidosus.AAC.24
MTAKALFPPDLPVKFRRRAAIRTAIDHKPSRNAIGRFPGPRIMVWERGLSHGQHIAEENARLRVEPERQDILPDPVPARPLCACSLKSVQRGDSVSRSQHDERPRRRVSIQESRIVSPSAIIPACAPGISEAAKSLSSIPGEKDLADSEKTELLSRTHRLLRSTIDCEIKSGNVRPLRRRVVEDGGTQRLSILQHRVVCRGRERSSSCEPVARSGAAGPVEDSIASHLPLQTHCVVPAAQGEDCVAREWRSVGLMDADGRRMRGPGSHRHPINDHARLQDGLHHCPIRDEGYAGLTSAVCRGNETVGHHDLGPVLQTDVHGGIQHVKPRSRPPFDLPGAGTLRQHAEEDGKEDPPPPQHHRGRISVVKPASAAKNAISGGALTSSRSKQRATLAIAGAQQALLSCARKSCCHKRSSCVDREVPSSAVPHKVYMRLGASWATSSGAVEQLLDSAAPLPLSDLRVVRTDSAASGFSGFWLPVLFFFWSFLKSS